MRAYCFQCERETDIIIEQSILIEEHEEMKHYSNCKVCGTKVCKIVSTETMEET